MKQKDPSSPKELIYANQATRWFSTNELLEYLGISQKELDQNSLFFKEGIHYRYQNPSDKTSPLLWRIDLIDELLCLPIPALEREAMLKAIQNDITCSK